MKVKDFVERLLRNYRGNDEVAYMIYTRDDVTMYLVNESVRFDGVTLTDTEKDEVLRVMDRTKDCELGMTWMSMANAIDIVSENRQEGQSHEKLVEY